MVVLGADGQVLHRAGEVAEPLFPRSSNKPMQAAGMVRCGLDADGRLLALAAASHSGEDFHIAGVHEILARAGLGTGALRCPPALPMDEGAQQALLRLGGAAERAYMNCSGKHAAMLATCVLAGWPTSSYLDPDHPLQVGIRAAVEDLAGERVAAVGVDGCGAPLFALSLIGVARAFRAMTQAEPGSAQRKVADVMRAYPDWTSGSTRPERALMAAVPGLLLKSGAEGVEGFALADGRAVAFKIEDGAARARPPLTVALLRTLGMAGEAGLDGAVGAGVDSAALERIAAVPVVGGDRVVGEVRVRIPF